MNEAAIFRIFVAIAEGARPDNIGEADDGVEGVRNSWLILARNSDFALLANTARACARFIVLA
jgi:hypothetical protein